MLVKLKKLNENAVLPSKAREGDFCYDVVAISKKRVGWRTWEYGLGFAYEIIRDDICPGFTPQKYLRLDTNQVAACGADNIHITKTAYSNVKLSIDFRPRSSIWKTGMILSNCEGTLDEFYRGEVRAVFYNINPFKKNYKVGDRIGQIKLGITLPLEFKFVDEINTNTERGTGGFGSTGIR